MIGLFLLDLPAITHHAHSLLEATISEMNESTLQVLSLEAIGAPFVRAARVTVIAFVEVDDQEINDRARLPALLAEHLPLGFEVPLDLFPLLNQYIRKVKEDGLKLSWGSFIVVDLRVHFHFL